VAQRHKKVFLTMRQLQERWGGCSHMTIQRKLDDDPAFPRPIKLGPKGRTRMWDEGEIEKYERASVR